MMNPEQIKQEQERVSALLNKFNGALAALKAAEAQGSPVPASVFAPVMAAQGRIQMEAVQFARAYLALLDAHLALHAQLAQAEGREKLLREALTKIAESENGTQECGGTGRGGEDCWACEEKQAIARAALAQAGEG